MNSLPADVKKTMTEFSEEFNQRWLAEWNKIEIEGKDYFAKQGGHIVPVADAEAAKWIKAVEPVVADYKKDVVSKGSKAADVDTWIAFVRERIETGRARKRHRRCQQYISTKF